MRTDGGRGRIARWAAPAALIAVGTMAAPAGAMRRPPVPELTLTAGGTTTSLVPDLGCDDIAPLPPMPDLPVVAAGCTPLDLPIVTLATPGTFELRTSRELTGLAVGTFEAEEPLSPAASVAPRDGASWTLSLPSLPVERHLRFIATTVAWPTGVTYYLRVRPAPPAPPAPPSPPAPARVTIVRAARHGGVITAVVRSTPGTLSVYLTANGRRRGAVVRTTVAKAATVRVRLPLGRRGSRSLPRSGGVTVVLKPSTAGQKQVRAGISWFATTVRR